MPEHISVVYRDSIHQDEHIVLFLPLDEKTVALEHAISIGGASQIDSVVGQNPGDGCRAMASYARRDIQDRIDEQVYVSSIAVFGVS